MSRRPDGSGSNSSDRGWVSWFCRLDGHSWLAEVEEDYLRDSFNLYGLRARVGVRFSKALEMVLSDEAPEEEELLVSMDLYRDATDLYGLIHSRFILSPRGLALMREKYLRGVFGRCPRVHCGGQKVLPVGLSDELRTNRVRAFCPKCQEVYEPRGLSTDIDGAFFGTSFPHIFLQTFGNLVPLDAPQVFTPKIFGFVVHNKPSVVEMKRLKGEYGASVAAEKRRKAEAEVPAADKQ